MKRVIIESPYAGNIERNVAYARAAMADCLARGEAPYASHLLYTQPGVLRDEDPLEREIGITAGFAWRDVADLTVFYVDLGWSAGMLRASMHAQKSGFAYETRNLMPPGSSLNSVIRFLDRF